MSNLIGGFDSPTQAAQLKLVLLQRALSNKIQISKEALALLLQSTNPSSQLEQLIQKVKQNNEFVILPKHFIHFSTPPSKPPQSFKSIEIVHDYITTPPVGNLKDMANYFANRLLQFKKHLQPRLSNLHSIANIQKASNEKMSVIGLVMDKRKTKNGNIVLEVEDLSGVGKVIISRGELLVQADEILYDEVVGITGTASKGVLFAEEITEPDLPVKREPKFTKETAYAAFISDVHVGSKRFLQDNFENMLDFISGKGESILLESQQEIIDNLKYIFVAGDIVDGIGIYPGQEKELSMPNIYAQYKETARLFAKIPEHIQIIACPGNHDYVRLAQPQPPVEREVAPEMYELPNLTFISSPGVVRVRPFENENTALTTLLYHGTSIDTIVPNVSSLKDGYKHPEKVMLSLLKKRHLSPQYASGTVPSAHTSDPMTIPEDIDIIHTGHVHSNGILNYRGVSLINSGTWQGITDFQKFLGHEPTPCRMPVMNLKNRQIKLLSFE
ncbi:TPA: metallophosphoesterase [archaeon]|nr:metallophosphoesterase [Candidatus Naiadarchaeales archaeon SRR2090159.bin1288]